MPALTMYIPNLFISKLNETSHELEKNEIISVEVAGREDGMETTTTQMSTQTFWAS